MKSTHRLLSLLLALLLTLSIIPFSAYAEDAPSSPTFRACAHSSSYKLQEDSREATDTTGGYRHYKCAECGAEYSYNTDPLVYPVNPKTGEAITFDYAINPYLPNFEFMPDNELHVFWSRADSEWRVYAVGSHDTKLSGWCGPDITCWSAPVYDLANWRYEAVLRDTGTFFACDFNYDLQTDQAVLYAFPFFGNSEMNGTHLWVNGHSVPDAYFTTPLTAGSGVVGLDGKNLFDPALYIADDGTMLATYDDSTGGTKHAQLAKVNASDRTKIEWTVDVKMAEGEPNTNGFNPKHYEGSTIDLVKAGGKSYWVIQYSYKSNWNDTTDYEKDVDGEKRWWPLVYIYSDADLTIDELKDFKAWHWGGVIGDNGGFFRQDPATGEVVDHADPVFRWGNNHGGLAYINGEWYVSNHRHTSTGAGRQGYIRKVDVSVADGKLLITNPEYTSSIGDSIEAFHTWPAYIACHLWPSIFSEKGAQPLYIESPLRNAPSDYWKTIYDNPGYAKHLSPVVGITDGAEIGIKYLNFGTEAKNLKLSLLLSKEAGYADGSVNVFIDAPGTAKGGTLVGSLGVTASAVSGAFSKETDVNGTVWSWVSGSMDKAVTGVHAVFFVFSAESDAVICKMDEFAFEDAAALKISSGVEQLVATYAANVPVIVEGADLGQVNVKIVSKDDGAVYGETAINGAGKAIINIPASKSIPAGSYDIIAASGTASATTGLSVVPKNNNIWTVQLDKSVEGKTRFLFAADISTKNGFEVKLGSQSFTPVQDGNALVIDYAAKEGDTFVISGVKYASLFPSYSFTFTAK